MINKIRLKDLVAVVLNDVTLGVIKEKKWNGKILYRYFALRRTVQM